MKRSLRKGSAGVSITYSDGDYSNNLYGSGFTVETYENTICLGIDLSSNLRVQDKAGNCYDDICSLIEKHSKLKWVQIDERQVIEGLASTYQKNPNATCQLKLIVGNKIFEYQVSPQESQGSLFLNIITHL